VGPPSVTYRASRTPVLRSINPRYGRVVGGDSVTFEGAGFSADASANEITLDGVPCAITAASETALTCTTGPRPGLRETNTSLFVEGHGNVAIVQRSDGDTEFKYANAWSDRATWGG